MTGYKPKRTQIVLKEEATSLDFILDPVIAANADGFLLKRWDHSFLHWWQSNLFVILVLILAFLLCVFLKKSRVLNRSKHRPNGGSKRPSLV
ncbi:unnamed protein product [Cuscuta campestris]|uniref:Uncharacterized protein n=1 Tax=Cuscuta campestris TaxID=132261 RepID=A0A484MDF5_9ASTE|nr:unnamed protein product [Cuscuta campestris]